MSRLAAGWWMTLLNRRKHEDVWRARCRRCTPSGNAVLQRNTGSSLSRRDIMLTGAFVVAGCLTLYLLLMRRITHAGKRMSHNFADEMASLSTRIAVLERTAEQKAQDGVPGRAQVRRDDGTVPKKARDCNRNTATGEGDNI